jgi:DNA primase
MSSPSTSSTEERLDLRLLYTDSPVGNDPVMILCPYHNDHDPSLAVYDDHLHCFGCGWHETARRHLNRQGFDAEMFLSRVPAQPKERVTVSDEELQEMVETYHTRLFQMGKEQYFLDRGLRLETIREFRLGYTGRAYAIPVPHIGNGQVHTVRFRRDDTLGMDGPKYWGIPGRNQVLPYAPRTPDTPLIWCEGELDTLIAVQAGYRAVSLTNGIGAGIDLLAQHLSGITEIRIAVDNDRAGYARSYQLGRELRDLLGCKIWYCRFPAKDLTEFYLKYGEAALRKVLGSV